VSWRSFALRLLGVGFYVAITIVLFTLGGLWLDNKVGTTPILALIGVTLGTFVAMFGVYLMVRPGLTGTLSNEEKDKEKD